MDRERSARRLLGGGGAWTEALGGGGSATATWLWSFKAAWESLRGRVVTRNTQAQDEEGSGPGAWGRAGGVWVAGETSASANGLMRIGMLPLPPPLHRRARPRRRVAQLHVTARGRAQIPIERADVCPAPRK